METRAEAFENVAGLLRAHGYQASVDPAYRPAVRGTGPKLVPVLAIVTCAPEMVVGMAFGQVAEEPEAHIPDRSAKVAKVRATDPGEPQFAHWCGDEEHTELQPDRSASLRAKRQPTEQQ